jgi:multidrug efflux pump subunit AcrA (membrane-fusion protein)
MNKSALAAALLASVALGSCSGHGGLAVPELADEPKTELSAFKDVIERVPAFGISTGSEAALHFIVNIEAEDTSRVRPGETAVVRVLPGKATVSCRVFRVLPRVSAETGQSLAWLKAEGAHPPVVINEFVYAEITTGIKRHALTVPEESVYIRNGKTWVIERKKDEKGKTVFAPSEVRVGERFGQDVEILKGLEPQVPVVTQGGIGLLYPDFKAQEGG